MTQRIFFRLLIAFLIVIGVAVATLNIVIGRAWERSVYSTIERTLREKTLMLATRVDESNGNFQQIAAEASRTGNARVTVIDRDGHVLADSEANPAEMENHATRPEFVAALAGKVGENSRWSHTLGVQFLYVAAPIRGGAVRMAYPLESIVEVDREVHRNLIKATLLAVVIAMVLAGLVSRSFSRRLNAIVHFAERIAAGDLTARIDERTASDEIAAVATALDRTARRLEQSFADLEESHKELETLLNSMQEAVIAIAADGRVLWANERMNRLVPSGVRIGAPAVETVRDPDFLRTIDEVRVTKLPHTARITWASVRRSFNLTAAPMPGGGIVAVLYDVSESERVEKTRRDFIANVSHELRTPLTSIQGYAETLLDETVHDANTTREFLEIIRKNSARMARLTEDLLTLARVESGEQTFKFQPVEANALLEDARATFTEIARGRNMEIVIAETSPERVHADPDAIHQVFSNLVENALKYSSEGTQIQLGARQAAGAIEFYVRDSGPGIPSEHLPRLFERFYRVDKARSRESGGTGLGLAIVKHIVRVHGGGVRADSEVGRGSEFSFSLPLANAATYAVPS